MNYTSIEQSEELVKLGLDPKTADKYYFLDPTPVGNIYHLSDKRVDVGVKSIPEYEKGDIPCWSVGALMDIISSSIKSISTVSMPVIYFHNKRIVYKIGLKTSYISKGESFLESCYDTVKWLLKEYMI